MSECVKFNGNGRVLTDVDTCQFVLLSQDEAVELANAVQNNLALFQFDSGMYEYILAQTLITFITGHVVGRVLKTFGKL